MAICFLVQNRVGILLCLVVKPCQSSRLRQKDQSLHKGEREKMFPERQRERENMFPEREREKEYVSREREREREREYVPILRSVFSMLSYVVCVKASFLEPFRNRTFTNKYSPYRI